jgi:hypothetical protein
VTVGKEGHQHQLEGLSLPDHGAFHLVEDAGG